jgi:hypothetical protein
LFNEKSAQNTPNPRPSNTQFSEPSGNQQQERRVQLQKKRQQTDVTSALVGLNSSSAGRFNDSLSLTPVRPENALPDISNTQNSLISLSSAPSLDVSFLNL